MPRDVQRLVLTVLLLAATPLATLQAEEVEVDPAWPSVGPHSRGEYVRTLKPVLREIEVVDRGVFIPLPGQSLPLAPQVPGIETALPSVGFTGVDGTAKDGFFHKPPDTHIAAGTGAGTAGRILMVTNSGIQLWDKTGTSLAGPTPLDTFLGTTAPDAFDPKVLFDHHSGRFFIVVLEGSTPNPGGTNNIHLAVSASATPSNLTSDWTLLVDSALTTINGINTWFDYPSIGADGGSLFVTGNLFDSIPLFRGAKIRIYDKSDLLAGSSTFTDLNVSDATTPGVFTVQPAHVLGAGTDSSDFYLVNRVNSITYRFWQITGAPASPTIVTNAARSWVAGAAMSVGAPQSGSSVGLQTLSARIMNAVYRGGEIWLTLTSDPDNDSRTEIFWARVETNGFFAGTAANPVLAASGYLDGSSSEAWTFMPSVSVNVNGQAAITYTQSSGGQFPDMRYTVRDPADPPGAFQGPVIAATSPGPYDAFDDDDPDRWGDYSAVVVDPENDTDFCAANETVQSSGTDTSIWGTYIACFEPSTAGTLSILAVNDYPAFAGGGSGVRLVVEARTCTDQVVQTSDLFWDENNNKLAGRSVDIPTDAERIRLTFKDDYCGPGCPQDPNDDRNAFIDKFTFNNMTREAEDFDRSGGTDVSFAGCEKVTDPDDSSRVFALCGNENDFVEYDLIPCNAARSIPTLSEWGMISLALLLAASGALILLARRRSPV